MTDRLTCDMVHDHDLVAKFVADRLSDEEVRAFEKHCLECDACWAELRLALGIHGAAPEKPFVSAPVGAPSAQDASTARRLPVWLLPAAAVLIFAVGASWMVQRPHPAAEVERGETALQGVNVSLATGKVVISWPPVENASRYVVALAGPDGHLLASREETAARTEFNRWALSADGAQVTVEAYSALGDRIATSAPVPVPSGQGR